jgi:putative ABC transport system permease protein
MRTLLRNVRYSARSLRKTPGFTLAAVLTLALGIGANTAVFSVVDAVALRPLPYPDAGRLVMVWDQLTKLGIDQFPPSFANYYDYRRENQVFEDIAAFYYNDLNLEGSADAVPERLEAMAVSANLFQTLRVKPALGQAFAEEQNQPGRADTVILSDGLWRRRFGADAGIVGQPVHLNGQTYRVQGVMPAGFEFTIRAGSVPDVWVPMVLAQNPARTDGLLPLIARVRSGVSVEQARANMAAIAAGIDAAHHPYNGPHGEEAGYRVGVLTLREQIFGNFRQGVMILLGAVVFVLLIACANVANLLLARGAARRRELEIRAALGASRWQLLAELGAESLVLALLGGCAGVLLARWGITALPTLGSLPEQAKISMDWRVLSFTLLLSLATGLLFSLAPALVGARGRLNLGGRTVSGGGRFRSGLVVAEVALSVALLVGSGLLLKSLAGLQRVDPGFDPRHVLAMRITLPAARYVDAPSRIAFFDRLSERLRGMEGVESAALVNQLPLAGGGRGGDPFSIEGRPYDSSSRVPQTASNYRMSAGYFRAMRIPLRAGRLVDQRDGPDAPPAAVINETMARGFWAASEAALGQHIMMGAPRPGARWLTIVGVVADVRNSDLRTGPIPQIYTPYTQGPGSSMFVVLRTAGDPMAVALAARRKIGAVDPGQAAFDIRTMEQRLSGSLKRDRFQTLLLGIFALAALALAAIGIYGLLEHSVSQRIPEIGLRMAMGAQPGDVLRLLVRQGMTPAILGLICGLAVTFALTRLLRTWLFGVAPTDPATFAVISILFLLVALLACVIPARRAMRVDLMTALRWE